MFTEKKKEKIIMTLKEIFKHGHKLLSCPMCGNTHFSIADAYLRNDLQPDMKSFLGFGLEGHLSSLAQSKDMEFDFELRSPSTIR